MINGFHPPVRAARALFDDRDGALPIWTGLSASEVIHDVVDNCVDKSLAFPRSLSTRACKRRAKRAKTSSLV